jgi:hypothetical protein
VKTLEALPVSGGAFVLPGKAVIPVHSAAAQPVTLNGPLESTLWTTDESAAAAGVTKKAFAYWVHCGYITRVNAKTARTALYRASEVLATEYAVRMRRGTNQWTAAA